MARALTFSRALCQLHLFTSNFDWFIRLSVFFVIGLSDNLGFGFTKLKTALYSLLIKGLVVSGLHYYCTGENSDVAPVVRRLDNDVQWISVDKTNLGIR